MKATERLAAVLSRLPIPLASCFSGGSDRAPAASPESAGAWFAAGLMSQKERAAARKGFIRRIERDRIAIKWLLYPIPAFFAADAAGKRRFRYGRRA